MRASRFAAAVLVLGALTAFNAAVGGGARQPPPGSPPPGTLPANESRFNAEEIVNAGHNFFGTVSRGLAQVVERAVSTWGLPNGYVLGEEAGGAFVAGLRYGEGMLYTKNAGDLKVYWQGPSIGWDVGGEGARTMMLIYNLPNTGLDLRAVRRHRRLRLLHRRLRHDGADRQPHRGGADPLGRRTAARRQHRLSEIHAEGDLEPALSGFRRRVYAKPR